MPIGSPRKRHSKRFRLLRAQAILAMDGREPYSGPIKLMIKMMDPPRLPESGLNEDYAMAIADSLAAMWGEDFRQNPIVFERESQIKSLKVGRFNGELSSL